MKTKLTKPGKGAKEPRGDKGSLAENWTDTQKLEKFGEENKREAKGKEKKGNKREGDT